MYPAIENVTWAQYYHGQEVSWAVGGQGYKDYSQPGQDGSREAERVSLRPWSHRPTSWPLPSSGADDLLPILSFVVLRSGLPQLVSECAALEEFTHEG